MAQARGIWICQYLHDWLLRAPSRKPAYNIPRPSWPFANRVVNLKFIKHQKSCTVRQFMSLIGLLTATEKQVWSGRLHMKPIQRHLKQHWHVPKVLEKVSPVLQSLHSHLDWWLYYRANPSASPSTRSSAVYRCLKRRLGRTLNGLHCKRRLVSC